MNFWYRGIMEHNAPERAKTSCNRRDLNVGVLRPSAFRLSLYDAVLRNHAHWRADPSELGPRVVHFVPATCAASTH